MAMKAQTVKTTAPPTEQSISAFLHAEVMVDLDNGQPTLVAATEANLGDLRKVAPAHARSMVAAARAKLDQIERLANEHEARDTLAAIVAEHGLQLEEWDTTTLEPKMRDTFVCFAELGKDGQIVMVVPAGQDPVERVDGVARLISTLQAQA